MKKGRSLVVASTSPRLAPLLGNYGIEIAPESSSEVVLLGPEHLMAKSLPLWRTHHLALPFASSLTVKPNTQILASKGSTHFIVENNRGQRGWVTRSQLSFRILLDQREIYLQFKEKVDEIFSSTSVGVFPNLTNFSKCKEVACEAVKKEFGSIGICVHDLEKVYRAAPQYTREFLKGERMKWHPDKVARYCHPAVKESVKHKSQQMFVMLTMLMEHLKK